MKNQENYLSTVKAIGIILMVIGHSGCPGSLSRGIYYFHMPLFFFVSGYFFKMNGKDRIIKKIKGLYIPYLKWSIPFLLLHDVFYSIGIYNSDYGYQGHGFSYYSIIDFGKRLVHVVFAMEKHEPLLGGFWFLKTLFLVSIMMILLSVVPSKHKKELIGVLCSVGLLVSKYFSLTFPIIGDCSIVFMGSVFYYFGFLYRMVEKHVTYHPILIISIFSLVFLLGWHGKEMSMFCPLADTVFYIPMAFMGIYASFGLSYNLECFRFKTLLYYIGKHTMQILALHFLSFKLVSIIIIHIYSMPTGRLSEFPVISYKTEVFWWLYSIVGVVCPLMLYQAYQYAKRAINEHSVFSCMKNNRPQ